MPTHETHRRTLARRFAALADIGYQEALRRVRVAASQGLLPAPLNESTYPAALEVVATVPGKGATAPTPDDTVLLGSGTGGQPVSATREALASHMLITGGPGHAAEHLASTVADQLLKQRVPGTLVTTDGLHPYLDALVKARPGGRVRRMEEVGGAYPLFADLSPTASARVLTALFLQDEYWRAINTNVANQALALLAAYVPVTDRPVTLGDLQLVLRDPASEQVAAMVAAVRAADPSLPIDRFATLANPTSSELEAGQGLEALLRRAVLGGWMSNHPWGEAPLTDYLVQPGLTMVAADAATPLEAQEVIGAAVVEHLVGYARSVVSGEVAGGPRFVVLDDVAALNEASVVQLLSVARSAGTMVILVAPRPDALSAETLRRFDQNCNVRATWDDDRDCWVVDPGMTGLVHAPLAFLRGPGS